MEAATQGHVDCVEVLLKHGANVELEAIYADGTGSGWTALHYAAYNRSLACVQALEAAGAELNRDSFEGGTPLDLVVALLEVRPDTRFGRQQSAIKTGVVDHRRRTREASSPSSRGALAVRLSLWRITSPRRSWAQKQPQSCAKTGPKSSRRQRSSSPALKAPARATSSPSSRRQVNRLR